MNKELMNALDQLEKEKGISKIEIIESIKVALETGYKKNFDKAENFEVDVNAETLDYKLFALKEVVDEVFDGAIEIAIEDAKALDSSLEIGDAVKIEIKPDRDFGRVAAQTSRQVILQSIREAERKSIMSEYENRESEIIYGQVEREHNGSFYIDLGKVEGILTRQEQIPGEKIRVGDKLRCSIVSIKSNGKSAVVLLSRTHIDFLKRLMELEIPEISEGVLEIINISREAGNRSKVAVMSHDDDVEVIGSCVGNKGMRIRNIIEEIRGEKVDVIEYTNSSEQNIKNALGPAKVLKVYVNEKNKRSLAVVPDDQLSLAIGKNGLNVKLAARLLGWKIDIVNESDFTEERLANIGDLSEEKSDEKQATEEKLNEEQRDEEKSDEEQRD